MFWLIFKVGVFRGAFVMVGSPPGQALVTRLISSYVMILPSTEAYILTLLVSVKKKNVAPPVLPHRHPLPHPPRPFSPGSRSQSDLMPVDVCFRGFQPTETDIQIIPRRGATLEINPQTSAT